LGALACVHEQLAQAWALDEIALLTHAHERMRQESTGQYVTVAVTVSV
jgi:hypothetical protein